MPSSIYPKGRSSSASAACPCKSSYTGGTGNDVTLTRLNPPTAVTVGENAGAVQRSMVTSVQVTFSTVVSIAP